MIIEELITIDKMIESISCKLKTELKISLALESEIELAMHDDLFTHLEIIPMFLVHEKKFL
jgi:hypothetical protein